MMLIDGGMIANDPSLLAYLHASYGLDQDTIRVVSIGTGYSNLTKINPKAAGLTWTKELGNLLTTVD